MPAGTFVCTLVHKLAAVINCAFIKWILCYGAVPVEAKFNRSIKGGRLQEPVLPCFIIQPLQVASLAHGIYPIRISCIRHGVKSIAASNIVPVKIPQATVDPGVGRTMPGAIILHATHNIVGKLVIYIDMVELPNRQVLIKIPRPAPVPGNAHSAIITIKDKIRILWRYPPGMVIGMNATILQQG